MNSPTRRTFLEGLSALTTGALFAGGISNAFAGAYSEPHVSFPTQPRKRISVASYPFRAYIDSPANRDRDKNLPGMTLLDFPAHVAAKFNVHNIEPHSRHFASLEPSYLERFRTALGNVGVKVVNIAVSAEDSFYDADSTARERAVAFAKKWVDVATAIGSPSMRTHIRGASNAQPNMQVTSDSLRKLTEYSASSNIVVSLENDDLVSEDAFFLVKVIEAVNNPYLRALPDFANSMMKGDAGFNYRALQAMFQHAYCICHVKDSEAGDSGKEFNVDLKKSFEILKASGYRGYCSMEYDAPGDPYGPTTKLIEQTVQYLS
ncbi:MAG: sugar phosphate isomerase/epimerase family protein [Candidatus Acidiferrum sp.]|jgi:sugar phosphate isomerase/epimerase